MLWPLLFGYRLSPLKRRDDFLHVGMTAKRLFRKDQRIIADHLKAAPTGWDQHQFADVVFQSIKNAVRQPDGTRRVVSFRTIFNRNTHFRFLSHDLACTTIRANRSSSDIIHSCRGILQRRIMHRCNSRPSLAPYGTFSLGIVVGRVYRRHDYGPRYRVGAALLFQGVALPEGDGTGVQLNKPSLRFFERPGFQREGCVRRMIFTHGQHFDVIIWGLTADEFAERHADMPSA